MSELIDRSARYREGRPDLDVQGGRTGSTLA
jgi:hypothetical protein